MAYASCFMYNIGKNVDSSGDESCLRTYIAMLSRIPFFKTYLLFQWLKSMVIFRWGGERPGCPARALFLWQWFRQLLQDLGSMLVKLCWEGVRGAGLLAARSPVLPLQLCGCLAWVCA